MNAQASYIEFTELKKHTHVIGDYSFDNILSIGDRLCFEDMMIYSMVKNNTFNGMPLPDIGMLHTNKTYEVIKKFSYQDFKERLS